MDIANINGILEKHGFEMKEQIGSGGYSACFKVFSVKYQQYFAVKVLDLSANHSESRSTSFMNEINALTHITHPNIIELYEYFTEKNYLFIVLEYCPGGDLLSYIHNNGPLAEAPLSSFIKIIADTLKFLHSQGFAHLDFKPSNILLDKNGRPKLADFGLCKHFEQGQYCKEFFGSPAFTSPEIVKHKNFDPFKADVWAFGVTVYYIATGEYPFNPKNVISLRNEICTCAFSVPPNISSVARVVINGALTENPADRPTIDGLIQLLQKKLQTEMPHSNTLLPRLKPIVIPPKKRNSLFISSSRKTGRFPYSLTRSLSTSSQKALDSDAFSKYLCNLSHI